MATYRLQVAIGADTPDIRDHMVMTPHFVSGVTSPDWDALALSACQAISLWFGTPFRKVKCTWYQADRTEPNYPLGEATTDGTLFPASAGPRDVALCLSYYSGANIPRRRGRLYFPFTTKYTANTVRPSTADMNALLTFVPVLNGIGGTDFAWALYSRSDDQGFPVTDAYVDNEWDTQRSRGLRPTARVSTSVP